MREHERQMKRVLFVCAGNTCRSPMAAALASDLLGATARVESAGTSADNGAEATRDAIQVMSERGLNIGAHRSRPLSAVKLADYDIVVAMTPEIGQRLRDKGVPAPKLHSLAIPDPLGQGVETYRATALAIERELKRIFGTSACGESNRRSDV